ncbi:MAG: fluoride efflux transporter CrcB [Sphingomicrobium sp.]
MNSYLLVFLGGGIGSVLRLGVYRLTRLWLSSDFPWGTFAVNVIGGFAAGLVTGWLIARSAGSGETASLFLMTGILGGFTTFSAFSVDAVLMIQRGQQVGAAMYILASVVFAIIGVVVGLAATRAG